jgi:hypothetical protein
MAHHRAAGETRAFLARLRFFHGKREKHFPAEQQRVILSLTHTYRPKVKAILLPWNRGVFYMRQFVSIITRRRGRF